MSKVAIMTINSLNFGNRLQNYALQSVIESLGHSVETIKRNKYIWDETSLSQRIKNEARVLLKTRKGLYISFDRKYIKFSGFYATPDEIDNNIIDKYDYFVVGSDQVWNPYYNHIVGSCDLLSFAPNSKRISYAASFGVEDVPFERIETYRSELSKFKSLSVREQQGGRLLKQLVNRDAEVVLDPTLLLGKTEWEKLACQPRNMKNHEFFLTYIIGDYRKESIEEIERLKSIGLEEINILKKNDKGREPAIGPAEFLWLIRHADQIVTDSFHATVFAILFNRPVKTYQRNGINMSSRIANLADTIGYPHNIDELGVFYMNGDEDYRMIQERLDYAISTSKHFLETSLWN